MQSSSTSTASPQAKRFRLPTSVKPVSYNLEYTKVDYWKEFTFSGTVTTKCSVSQNTSVITLHSKNLQIESILVDGIAPSSWSIDKTSQMLDISLASPLTAGKDTTLIITFSGVVNDSMCGFYRSPSKNEDGSDSFVASTQFESTDARQAFPCFDEPMFRADFTLTLISLKSHSCLSNTRVVSSTILDGENDSKGPNSELLVQTKFATLKSHPTYLYAWAIGPFTFIEKSSKGIRYRVYSQHSNIHKAPYALQWAIDSLEALTDLYQVPYPLDKMDLVCIPEFAAGAMENTGLVTYRDVCVLIDDKLATSGNRRSVAYTISHENTHQWAGNLVTPKWWKHLWLNEAHATWIGWIIADQIDPSMRFMDHFLVGTVSRGFALDTKKSTHPIEVEIQDADDVDEIFDAISYCKGAAVLAMLWDYIGRDTFVKGEREFIKRFKYSNADSVDFWNCMSLDNPEVSKMMHVWTSVPGYPLLTTKVVGESLQVDQTRFTVDPAEKYDSQWIIPIRATRFSSTGKELDSKYYLLKPKETVSIPIPENGNGCIKLNGGQHGFYRVNYPTTMWTNLSKIFSTLSFRDQLGLISDSFHLSKAGLVPITVWFNLAIQVKQSKDELLWALVTSCLGSIALNFSSVLPKKKFESFCTQLCDPLFQSVGLVEAPNDSESTKELRKYLFTLGRYGNHPEIVKFAWSMYSSFIQEFEKATTLSVETEKKAALLKSFQIIPPGLVNDVFRISMAKESATVTEQLKKVFSLCDYTPIKSQILVNLGTASSKSTIFETIEWSKKTVRKSNFHMLFWGITVNTTLKESNIVLEWLEKHWDWLKAYTGDSNWTIARFIVLATQRPNNSEQSKAISNFFSGKDIPGCKANLEQGLEGIKLRSIWFETGSKDIIDYFSK